MTKTDGNGLDAQAFVGIRRVCEISGFSKGSIRRKIIAGTFPAPAFREGNNVVRWDLASVLAWRQQRMRESAERNALSETQQAAA